MAAGSIQSITCLRRAGPLRDSITVAFTRLPRSTAAITVVLLRSRNLAASDQFKCFLGLPSIDVSSTSTSPVKG